MRNWLKDLTFFVVFYGNGVDNWGKRYHVARRSCPVAREGQCSISTEGRDEHRTVSRRHEMPE